MLRAVVGAGSFAAKPPLQPKAACFSGSETFILLRMYRTKTHASGAVLLTNEQLALIYLM